MSKKVRIIVAGSRKFNNYEFLCGRIDRILTEILSNETKKEDVTFISGCAIGVDLYGERYANDHGYNLVRFPAEWNIYGKPAGMIRNKQMAGYASEDGYDGYLIAFWNGSSRGTKNMIDNATKFGLKTFVVYI